MVGLPSFYFMRYAVMADNETKIWRKDPISGAWRMVKSCAPNIAHQWLVSSQQQEPDVTFKISPKRPTH